MGESWGSKIKKSKIIQGLKSFLQRLVLPGFDGMNLYDVAKFFLQGILKGSVTMRASALSYSFFFAIFPTILFFFTLIPYIPISGFQETLMLLIQDALPPNTYEEVKSTIEGIILKKNGGWLSVSFALSLIFATNGVSAIIAAFNRTYHSIETRSYLKQRVLALLLTVGLSVLLIIAVSLIIFGTETLTWVSDKGWIKNDWLINLISVAKWITLILLLYLIFSTLYYYAPAKRKNFRFISAGSSFATILTIVTSIGFDYYVSNFSRYNALYGSIGTLIVVLMWINFNATILLLGFELNASISAAKRTVFKKRNRLEESTKA
jgi:membrane protein